MNTKDDAPDLIQKFYEMRAESPFRYSPKFLKDHPEFQTDEDKKHIARAEEKRSRKNQLKSQLTDKPSTPKIHTIGAKLASEGTNE